MAPPDCVIPLPPVVDSVSVPVAVMLVDRSNGACAEIVMLLALRFPPPRMSAPLLMLMLPLPALIAAPGRISCPAPDARLTFLFTPLASVLTIRPLLDVTATLPPARLTTLNWLPTEPRVRSPAPALKLAVPELANSVPPVWLIGPPNVVSNRSEPGVTLALSVMPLLALMKMPLAKFSVWSTVTWPGLVTFRLPPVPLSRELARWLLAVMEEPPDPLRRNAPTSLAPESEIPPRELLAVKAPVVLIKPPGWLIKLRACSVTGAVPAVMFPFSVRVPGKLVAFSTTAALLLLMPPAATVRSLTSTTVKAPVDPAMLLKSLPLWARLTAPPGTFRVVAPPTTTAPAVCAMLLPCRNKVPLVLRLCARVRAAEPLSSRELPVRLPGVVNTPPLPSCKPPEPTLMLPAGRVSTPPAKNDRLALARLRVNDVTTSALSSDTTMLPPDTLMVLKLLPALGKNIAPVPLLTVVAPVTVIAPLFCRMSPPTEARVSAPLPAFTLASRITALPLASPSERNVMLPPVLFRAANTYTALPLGSGPPLPGALAYRVIAPALVVIGAFTVIWPPTCTVRLAFSVVKFNGSTKRMFSVACNVTLPPTALSVLGAMDNPAPGLSANWSTSAAAEPPPICTSIARGSSSKVPTAPCGARRLTAASNSRRSLPETSTKPPSPPCGPPCALMLP